MIYFQKPGSFKSNFDVVSCYLEDRGKFLLLRRPLNKKQGGKWGVPAGKVEKGESNLKAMVRELKEETGLQIKEENINYFNSVFAHHPEDEFIYHMFSTVLEEPLKVKISAKEHEEFRWVTLEESLGMELVDDLDECIKMYFKL